MTIDIEGLAQLAEHAEVIRTLGKRAIRDIIEIGRRLTDAKAIAVLTVRGLTFRPTKEKSRPGSRRAG